MERLASEILSRCHQLGFQGVGIAGPGSSDHGEFFRWWTEQEFHGEMGYMARPDALDRRADLRLTFEDVRSVVVVSHGYYQPDPPGIPEDPSRGVVARYARGVDYHDVLKNRLEDLLVWIRQVAGEQGLAEDVRGFPYVDTGPILERELGLRAGLGWFGKNTMLIHPRRGSFSFLGLLLLDLPLPPTAPFESDRCGTCEACLGACPTGALLGRDGDGAPVMDARRCISYLTIELKGVIPRELRSPIGNRVFGCDICQEVCPWNRRFAVPAEEAAYRAGPDTSGPALLELMALSEEEFASRFSGSPIKRTKRRGLLRNVAVALGNWLGAIQEPPEEAVSALVAGLSDPGPLVRGHSAWALGRVGSAPAIAALADRAQRESDPWVMEEISAARGC